MGDISEMRGLITAVTFLGVLTLLLMWIPPELYTAADMREVYTPEVFESIGIYDFAETKTIRLNETGGDYWAYDPTYYINDVDIGEWYCALIYKTSNETGLDLRLRHLMFEWWIIPTYHNLRWADRNGIDRTVNEHLTVANMETYRDPDNNASSMWRASCNHFTYHVSFAYNNTMYANFTHAWNNNDLFAFFGVDFTHVNTSYNAFQLMAMLLFFQLPQMNVYINALLAIPIWACIAYLAFIFVLRAIGAIFGGGA